MFLLIFLSLFHSLMLNSAETISTNFYTKEIQSNNRNAIPIAQYKDFCLGKEYATGFFLLFHTTRSDGRSEPRLELRLLEAERKSDLFFRLCASA